MKSYKITLPCGRQFTCITYEPERDVPAAILERFGVMPVNVTAL